MLRSTIVLAGFLAFSTLASAGYEEATQAYAAGNYDAALKEFRALADQGDGKSAYFVGVFYHNGFGVQRDDAEAAKWFKRAAEQNHPLAQYYMGKLSEQGRGVDKDLVAADMWFTLSEKGAANERDVAYTQKEINRIERRMTPDQITKAKDLAKNWKPSK